MPDLKGVCKPIMPRAIVQFGFIGVDHVNESTSLLLRVIVRLVDKSLFEYALARSNIIGAIEEVHHPRRDGKTQFGYMIDFINHMENCINSCGRVLKLLRQAVNDPALKPVATIQAALSHETIGVFVQVRNTVEHMEERISSGQLSGGSISLVLTEDSKSVEIGVHSVELSALASLIQALHEATQSAIWPVLNTA